MTLFASQLELARKQLKLSVSGMMSILGVKKRETYDRWLIEPPGDASKRTSMLKDYIDTFVGVMNEDWRTVPGISTVAASSMGRIISFSKRSNAVGHIMKPGLAGSYLYLYVAEAGCMMYVHRLVALAFHENPDNKPDVAHIDGNSINNVPSNLRWSTEKENCADKILHGTENFGTRNGAAKLDWDDVDAIKSSSDSNANLVRKFGVSHSSIHRIKTGKAWAVRPSGQ